MEDHTLILRAGRERARCRGVTLPDGSSINRFSAPAFRFSDRANEAGENRLVRINARGEREHLTQDGWIIVREPEGALSDVELDCAGHLHCAEFPCDSCSGGNASPNDQALLTLDIGQPDRPEHPQIPH